MPRNPGGCVERVSDRCQSRQCGGLHEIIETSLCTSGHRHRVMQCCAMLFAIFSGTFMDPRHLSASNARLPGRASFQSRVVPSPNSAFSPLGGRSKLVLWKLGWLSKL